MHGGHQVAQKFNTNGFPLKILVDNMVPPNWANCCCQKRCSASDKACACRVDVRQTIPAPTPAIAKPAAAAPAAAPEVKKDAAKPAEKKAKKTKKAAKPVEAKAAPEAVKAAEPAKK